MRHRICGHPGTGLGNPSPEMMDNQASGNVRLDELVKRASKDAYKVFFKSFGYCDAAIRGQEILLGVEPAYRMEYLKMIVINENKGRSYCYINSNVDSNNDSKLKYVQLL